MSFPEGAVSAVTHDPSVSDSNRTKTTKDVEESAIQSKENQTINAMNASLADKEKPLGQSLLDTVKEMFQWNKSTTASGKEKKPNEEQPSSKEQQDPTEIENNENSDDLLVKESLVAAMELLE